MKNLFNIIDEKLKKRYWYSEREYQYVKSGLIGFSLSAVLIILKFISFYFT